MGFRRISLKGFPEELAVRRMVEGFEQVYICSAILYRGKHWRRKVDAVHRVIGTEYGVRRAKELSHEASSVLRERHGLPEAPELD